MKMSVAVAGLRAPAAAFLAAALAVTGACTSPAPGGPSADRLVVARPADAVSLDPARTADIESLEVAEQVYGRLVRFSAGRLEPEPDLATSWKVSSDGTIWTFQLREGVTFDGSPACCHASTRRGTPCQRVPLPGSKYCPSHKHLDDDYEVAA